GLVEQMRQRQYLVAVASKGQLPGQKLKGDDADGVHIGCRSRGLTGGLLRREVVRAAPDHLFDLVRLGLRRAEGPRDAEVRHLDAVVGRDEDVLRLEVAV